MTVTIDTVINPEPMLAPLTALRQSKNLYVSLSKNRPAYEVFVSKTSRKLHHSVLYISQQLYKRIYTPSYRMIEYRIENYKGSSVVFLENFKVSK